MKIRVSVPEDSPQGIVAVVVRTHGERDENPGEEFTVLPLVQMNPGDSREFEVDETRKLAFGAPFAPGEFQL